MLDYTAVLRPRQQCTFTSRVRTAQIRQCARHV